MKSIADYELIQSLGEGSHGSFWLARCPERLGVDTDQVAVKIFAHNAAEGDLDRLWHELRYYRSVTSPHLAEIYEVGQQGAVLYYAGEYFPDGSLARPARPFSRSVVLAALAAAARGAHALHEAGVAHRDIKPGNVMLDDEGAKLGDPNLATVLNPGQTITGLDRLGAIEYLAPELVQGQSATRSSDIWALGATMHRVLTGRSVYPDLPDGSLLEALRHLLNERPTLNETLRPEERAIVERTLATDPVDRPATAADLAETVEELARRLAAAEPT